MTEKVKYSKSSKYLIYSIFVLVFSMMLLLVNALGTTLAWFTDSDVIRFGGTTATISLQTKNGESVIDSSDIILNSSSNSAITVKNASTISVYIRVMITCNWQNSSAQYGSASSQVALTVPNTWYAPNGNIGSYIYFKGAVTVNTVATIISQVEITSIPEGAGAVVLNVWAEAVQANDGGLNAIKPSDLTLNQFKTALGISIS